MSERTESAFPRRDRHGRVVEVVDMFGVVLAGIVLGTAILLLIDWTLALLGSGEFGDASGWLALTLPAFLFVEEFRAWRGSAPRSGVARIAAALVAGVVGLGLGLLAAGVFGGLPAVVRGVAGAAVAGMAYAVVWFYGIRWLDRRITEGEP